MQVRDKKIGPGKVDAELVQGRLHRVHAFLHVQPGVDYEVSIRRFYYVRVGIFQRISGKRYLRPEQVFRDFFNH